ncbi:hypothetical protein QCA50_011275 [Cerrena zonata]|uniref:F-box domain-containing protein n=1 Tax=Cerrena zonata TaxID=2478898 RepID=A0AAW0G1L8_9APHY
MPITDLPAELLLDIFTLACVDTGFTGCSLRGVSQHFRVLCTQSGVDVHTVALCGVKKMKSFQAMLKERKQDSSSTELSSQVLQSISPRELRILSVDLPSWRPENGANPLFRQPFPFLTDLTLRCGLDVPFFNVFHPCPNLQRLHIASHKQLPNTFGASISRIAPDLKHLRLSGVDGPTKSGNLHQVLQAYTSSSPSSHPIITDISDPLKADHELPASVNKLIIGFDTCFQFTHPIHSSRRQMNYLQNAQAIHQLAEDYRSRGHKETTTSNGERPVAGRGERPIKLAQRKLLLVHPTPPMRPYDDVEEVAKANFAKLRAEWEDRVQGGEAGWGDVPSSPA